MNDLKKPSFFHRMHQKLMKLKIYGYLTGLFSMFILIYLTVAVMAPLKTLKMLKEEYQPKPGENWEFAAINDKTDSILKSKSSLNSRLLLTENDSICLSLNLEDSLLNLELQGVTIHRTKISYIKTSRIFSKMGNQALYKYISTPFTLQQYHATIVKIPIVVKQAPKDTIEANKINAIPQLPSEKFVRYAFGFDKRLKLLIEQEEKPSGRERFRSFADKNREKVFIFKTIACDIFKLKIPDYQPWIKIKMPANEAKTIFRALPVKAEMTLKL